MDLYSIRNFFIFLFALYVYFANTIPGEAFYKEKSFSPFVSYGCIALPVCMKLEFRVLLFP